MRQPSITIVVPLYNERKNLSELYAQLKPVLKQYDMVSKILFVDDGSNDGSKKILNEISQKDECVIVHFCQKHRGQFQCLEYGFAHIETDYVITFDGDLEGSPGAIPAMVEKLEEGYDVVCGWRAHRRDSWQIKYRSKLGNFLQRAITKISVHDLAFTTRAYRREVVEGLTLSNEYEIFFLPLVIARKRSELKPRITEIKIPHTSRKQGKSRYNFFVTIYSVVGSYLKFVLGF